MKRLLYIALPCFGLLLTGCAQDRLAPLDRTLKPPLYYWEKVGVTPEGKQEDSRSCRRGGVSAGGIYRADFDKARLPGETENAAYIRLTDEWARCMRGLGYRFTKN